MNLNERKSLGKRIKNLRELRGLTQDQLADALQVKRPTISNYELGRALPPVESLIKLASILKTSVDDLLKEAHESDINEIESYTEGFGGVIREDRKDKNLTQKELADLTGISQGLLSQYERDATPIPIIMADKLAQSLGYDDSDDILDQYGILFEDKEQIEFDKANDEDHWREEAEIAKHDAALGKALKAERLKRNLSQADLANKSKISREDLSSYERGKETIPEKDLMSILKTLNMSIDDLYARHHFPDQMLSSRFPGDVYMGGGNEMEAKAKDTTLPSLSKKNERDIGKQLQNILDDLNSNTALAYDGEPMDPNTQKLVRAAIESSLHLTKQIAKQKFTPKKYRDWE